MPISDRIIFAFTSSCLILSIAIFNASLEPWTSDFIIILSSSLSLTLSKSVVLSFAINLFFAISSLLIFEISFASSSFGVTKNSAPAKAELFIPKISTGIDGKASFIIFPS